MSRVFVIGSSNTDMVIKSKYLPKPGQTILGGTFMTNPGGKGANQAVAAAKLGAVVTLLCKVGEDIFGDQAIVGFHNTGIDTRFIRKDPNLPSGVALILVDEKGENCISVASGANANLGTSELTTLIDQISPGDIVLLQLEIPTATVEEAARLCFERGARVILNPAPATRISEKVHPYISILTPNETEATLLTGIEVKDGSSAEEAAKYLAESGIATVVITLGAQGAYLFNENVGKLIPAPQVQAVDTTAAGDVFNGALAVALAKGANLEDAINFACSAAAISVTRLGAQSSAPTRRELEDQYPALAIVKLFSPIKL